MVALLEEVDEPSHVIRNRGREIFLEIDKELLSILCCPETKQPLTMADTSLIAKVNDGIAQGLVKSIGQRVVSEKLDGGLLRADRKILYPIRENIPVLLIEEGILVDHLL